MYVGEYPEWIDQLSSLYADLMTLRHPAGLHNWEPDACASKTLGQLAPSAFVMWDNKIKVYVAGDYRTFLFEMHALATRLIDESPVDAAGVEQFLQGHLGYKVQKTLAKYLDEYNWHVAAGRGYRRRA